MRKREPKAPKYFNSESGKACQAPIDRPETCQCVTKPTKSGKTPIESFIDLNDVIDNTLKYEILQKQIRRRVRCI